MNLLVSCTRCGEAIPPDSADGMCAVCQTQVRFALESTNRNVDGLAATATFVGQDSAATLQLPDPDLPSRAPIPLEVRSRRIGNYDLVSELGRGGMGVVYRAVQREADRIVALKLLLGGAASSEGDRERFRAEIQSLARLRHPHIVPVYEVGEEDGCPYFSMEFVPGGTLTARAKRSPLSHAEAASIVEKLALAVEQAHRLGILHRDIKPGNVLLDADGTPKLTDFGLAKRLDSSQSLTLTGSAIGTPGYMPPEQANSGQALTPAADVYSLGATLYALLVGRPPFVGDTPLAAIQKVLAEEPRRPRSFKSAIPRDLEAICLKCLEKSPLRRYATAQSLAEDLARWREGKSTVARPQTWPVRAWRRARRHWRAWAAVAVAAACIAVLTAMWPRREPDPLVPIETALKRGEKVTLVGPTGAPSWQRWTFGTGSVSDPAARTPFLVSCRQTGYLELVPRTHQKRFRLTLEFRMEEVTDTQSWAGLYFGRVAGTEGGGRAIDRVFAVVLREDLPKGKPPFKPGNPLVVRDSLLISLPEQPFEEPGSPLANLWINEGHLAPNERPWRRLEVDVEPSAVSVRFAHDASGPTATVRPYPIPAESLENFPPDRIAWLDREYPGLETSQLVYDPAGGCGLIVTNARVFFRNFAIEPLP